MKFTTAAFLVSAVLPFTRARVGKQQQQRTLPEAKKQKSKRLPKHIAEKAAQTSQIHRIVGGEDAAVGEFPWFADWGGCGGTLIYEDIVLTAGHCVGVYTNDIYIGAYEEHNTTHGAELRSVVNRHLHPEYKDCTVENDVAVLKLDRPSGKTPVALNGDPALLDTGDTVVAIGHGVTNVTTYETSTILQKVAIPFVNHTQCNSNYATLYPVIEDCMICAGHVEGGVGTCSGDSGGPLLKQVEDGSYVQVGVTSWGVSCASPDYPGVYSRISTLKSWIEEQVCLMSDNPPSTCAPPPEGTIPVRLDFVYDSFPYESGWSVTKGCECHANCMQGTAFQAGPVTERLYLDPGEYTFSMTDYYGDGICCDWGEGNVTIVAELPDHGDVVLAKVDGEFTTATSKKFTVSTEPPPLCQDSDTETFLVSEEVGEKDCEWLAQNMDAFGSLCDDSMNVAVACPMTCDICDQLSIIVDPVL